METNMILTRRATSTIGNTSILSILPIFLFIIWYFKQKQLIFKFEKAGANLESHVLRHFRSLNMRWNVWIVDPSEW